MQAKKRFAIGMAFICILLIVSLPKHIVMAGEQVSEEIDVIDGMLGKLNEGEVKVKDIERTILEKLIRFLPYIGVILFVIGIFVAVFSIRNKGNRRWGIKLAVTEAIIVYFLYISMTFAYDFFFQKNVIGLLERPGTLSVYGRIYYNTLERLYMEGQQFVFLGEGWQDDFVNAIRRMYMSIVGLLSFASIGIGVLLLVVNKREKGFRRFAFAGMCIAIPAALIVGYQFLKM